MQALIIILLTLSGILTTVLGVASLRRQELPATRAFAVTMFAAAIWSFGFAVEILSTTLANKIFWANVQYIGIVTIPLSWLIMTYHYTGKPVWAQRGMPYLTSTVVLFLIVIWTDSYTHIFRVSPSVDVVTEGFTVLNNDYGSFFYFIFLPITQLPIFISAWHLMRFWIKSTPFHRPQRFILFFSLLLPLIVSIFYLLDISLIPHFNMTPLTFSLSGFLVSMNVFSRQFLNLTPLALDVVMSSMKVGVIVLDSDGRITDFNNATRNITHLASPQDIGSQFIDHYPELKILLDADDESFHDVPIKKNGQIEHFDVTVKAITGFRKRYLGRVITLTNITEIIELYEHVKELSIRDMLTGALNRGAFLEKAAQEIKRAQRHDRKFSLIMLDVDDFKQINDKAGHLAGDAALQTITKLCRKEMRSTDVIGRYGGDEFMILLPETKAEEARQCAERMHQQIATYRSPKYNFSLNASMGITEWQHGQNVDDLIQHADMALYKVKQAGKGAVALN